VVFLNDYSSIESFKNNYQDVARIIGKICWMIYLLYSSSSPSLIKTPINKAASAAIIPANIIF